VFSYILYGQNLKAVFKILHACRKDYSMFCIADGVKLILLFL